MSSCCGPFEDAADRLFTEKKAAQELEAFHRRGPGPTAALLAEGIAAAGLLSGSLLDIGGGIGGLTFTLLERGASGAVVVDASTAYVRTARDEADRRGVSPAIEVIHADFVDIAHRVSSAAIVTLDRVVCCYPRCEPLLTAAAAHAERCFALAYPRDVWYIRMGMTVENTQRRVTRNPFRTFVHPARLIHDIVRKAGFTLASRRETWVWSVDVYARP